MNKTENMTNLPDVRSIITKSDSGEGYSHTSDEYIQFEKIVFDAIKLPSQSTGAIWLRNGIEIIANPDEIDAIIILIWANTLRSALEKAAETHFLNNSDIAPIKDLQKEFWKLFIDSWAKQYLQDLDGHETTDPLWSYVELLWLKHLKDQRAKRNQKLSEIGILFVHGIGSQTQGETLEKYGNPFVEWFGVNANIRETKLKTNNIDDAPAYSIIDHPSSKDSWVLAESWWADQFMAPSFKDLSFWLITKGPSLTLAHIGKWFGLRMRRLLDFLVPPEGNKWLWLISGPAILTVGIVGAMAMVGISFWLTIILQLFSLVLWVLSVIPIVRSQSAISRVLLTLRTILGDSFAFVNNPISRSAILSQVSSDLKWISERCSKLVIVAHSQGAALAHNVLRKDVPDNVKLLVTLGSGLGKLERAGKQDKNIINRSVSWVVPTLPLFVWIILVIGEQFASLILWGGAFYLVTYITALTMAFRIHNREELNLEPVPWIDYYASNDPVPNGALILNDSDGCIKSYEVHNYGSVISDHTTYFENKDEFVTSVLRDIKKYTDSANLTSKLNEKVEENRALRVERIRFLQGLRFSALLAWIVGGYTAGKIALLEWGIFTVNAEFNLFDSTYLLDVMYQLGLYDIHLPYLSVNLVSFGYIVIGLVVLGFTILPFYILGYLAWKLWNRAEVSSNYGIFNTNYPFKKSYQIFCIDSFVFLLPYLIAITATSLLIILNLSSLVTKIISVIVIILGMLMIMGRLFDELQQEIRTQILYVSPVITSVVLMFWISTHEGLHGALWKPYTDLWDGIKFIANKMRDFPEAFMPVVLIFGITLAQKISKALNEK